MEYLQGAFESYKSQLHFETEQRWKAKQGELEGQYEADIQAKVQQLRECGFACLTVSSRIL